MPSVLTAAQVREAFLRFFEQRGHRRVASSPLVPQNDPTLLFTNAGMVQFKDVFTGREKRDYARATTSQKCVRAGGKHNDLDNVGFTARHHTFFEMLGNFSFGDYFKSEAIAFAWDFVRKELGLPENRLAVTVFNGEKGLPWDEEAFGLWVKQGVPESRVFKLGYKDNFWAMGDVGPCGPCSEIHFHQGDDLPCAEVAAGRPCLGVACDCDRWLEIWNLVFMQFERKEKDGPLVSLPRPSIDTGAGLERIASVVQAKRSNYDTDLFAPLLAKVSELCGKEYAKASPEDAASMRVIADHSRAAAFLIADGVQPSNEGRGYVLRRIMRRAIRHGSKLGLDELFMPATVGVVVSTMNEVYPELERNKAFVLEATRYEEESFRRSLNRGLKLIDEEVARMKRTGEKRLHGELVFFLHDTHGMPPDLTQIILREHGLDADEPIRPAQAQAAGALSSEKAIEGVYFQLSEKLGPTTFLGYDGVGHAGEGSLRAILRKGTEVEEAHAGDEVEMVFDRTPFYGESGGQVGDTGQVTAHGGKAVAKVLDAQKPVPELVVHKVKVQQGTFKRGDMAALAVDGDRRSAIRGNHSATHLLHKALKRVLGEHVNQKGSVVAPDYLRFDYAHFSPPTPEQLEQVEEHVNRWVRDNAEADTQVMGLEDARKSGAVALFGEKYGDKVRVVKVHPESTELCGGTHVKRTGEIGLFKITAEGSVASGVRRITAVTGAQALAHVQERERDLKAAAELFRIPAKELPKRIEGLQKRLKELEKQLEEASVKAQSGKASAESVREVNGLKVLTHLVDTADEKLLRGLADRYRDQLQSGVVGLGGPTADGKALILVAATKDVVARGVKAGDLVREMAKEVGGKGGGKPDLAQAGGPDASKVGAALEKLYELVKATAA